MLWVDEFVQEAEKKLALKIRKGKPLVIRDEKTASGRVHVGSLRGVAIHGAISEVLSQENISNKYLFEINDFDPMDGIPANLDQEFYKAYLGKPLYQVPSPDGKTKNFAEFYGQEFKDVILELGYKPEFYLCSDMYRAGKYNDCIKLALEKSSVIRDIYKRISGSIRAEDWNPLQVICEKCGKVSTTKVSDFDGTMVTYACKDLEWTNGCGHTGKISPFNGNAKLPWKVEWAAKFGIFEVDIEGAGKDHSTKGGSRDVAEAIAREVFGFTPPLNIPYEFLHIDGKKMSSSKGAGSSSREMADLLPPQILRLLLLQKPPQRVVDFAPEGDTIPILYDNYDRYATEYFSGNRQGEARIFSLIHFAEINSLLENRFLPRFSQIAYLVQMPHIDLFQEMEKEKGGLLTPIDRVEIELRKKYALRWLELYAPQDYKFDLKKELPDAVKNLSPEQKVALQKILEYIRSKDTLDGQELHTNLHEIRKVCGLEAKSFFGALYLSFLGKSSGPKAGWFLSVLDKKFVEKRLEMAIE